MGAARSGFPKAAAKKTSFPWNLWWTSRAIRGVLLHPRRQGAGSEKFREFALKRRTFVKPSRQPRRLSD
jgi:hypothetical protein